MLAAFTYSSGLRAPALIAFVKDTLIYLVIVVAIVWVPLELGFGDVFHAAQDQDGDAEAATVRRPASSSPTSGRLLGLLRRWRSGSALALFMYPHSMTAVLSGKTRNMIRRNATILPAYSLLLGLLALLGFAAIAAGTSVFGSDGIANAAAGRAAPVRGELPELVRRRRVQRDRDRRAGAVGDHVDRGREPVHPQHLQGVHQEGRHARRGGQGVEDHVAGGEVRRAAVRARHWTSRTRSTCSCSAACGSCRRSSSIVAGLFTRWFHRGRCSPAGRSAWSTARSWRTADGAERRDPSWSTASR